MQRVFSYGNKVRYRNSGTAAIVVYRTSQSVLIQTDNREYWVKPNELDFALDREEDFANIHVPSAEEILSVESRAQATVQEYVDEYKIATKDRIAIKDFIVGAVLRKKLLQLRDQYDHQYPTHKRT